MLPRSPTERFEVIRVDTFFVAPRDPLEEQMGGVGLEAEVGSILTRSGEDIA